MSSEIKFRNKLPELEMINIVKMSQETLFSDLGSDALNYLTNVRYHDINIIKKFQIGYVPKFVKNDLGYDHEFSDRIVFPIFDSYGLVVALSSRYIGDNEYKNKFHHSAFDKSYYLYGFHESKKSIIKNKKCIIVEGEQDVLSMHKFGFNMTVGCLGSAVGINQISMLSRYCSEIFFCFDNDIAGKVSEKRMRDIYKEYHLDNYDIKFYYVNLPKEDNVKKVDIDEYINKNGKNAVLKLLRESREEL